MILNTSIASLKDYLKERNDYITRLLNNIDYDKYFKNEREFVRPADFFSFVFFIIMPNIQNLLSSMPTGFLYIKLKKIFQEFKIIIITLERMPWLEEYVPLLKGLSKLKNLFRDLELICVNFDRLINWSHRNGPLERIRIVISSIMAFIRLICLKNLPKQKTQYKKKRYNRNQDMENTDFADSDSVVY